MTYEKAMQKVQDGDSLWEETMNTRWCVRRTIGGDVMQVSTTGAQLPFTPTREQRASTKWRIVK